MSTERATEELIDEIRRISISKYGWDALYDYHMNQVCVRTNLSEDIENALHRGNNLNLEKIYKECRLLDLSSCKGIPDIVRIDEGDISIPECIKELQHEPDVISVSCCSLHNRKELKIPSIKHPFFGSGNAREQESVKRAAQAIGLSVSAFVTKATLYMARFINRHRRKEQGHPYHPGEAYLFMKQGEKMQDAFTPEEVSQVLENVGLKGSLLAETIMRELEGIREQRKRTADIEPFRKGKS